MATADEWVAAFAGALGQDPPSAHQVARVLELARVAAQRSERRAAPLACWLAASAGLTAEQALPIAESLDPPTDPNPSSES